MLYLFRKCTPNHSDKSKEVNGDQGSGTWEYKQAWELEDAANCHAYSHSVGINHVFIFYSLNLCPMFSISFLDSAINLYTFNHIFFHTDIIQECARLREIKTTNFSNSAFSPFLMLSFFTQSFKHYEIFCQHWCHVYLYSYEVIKCLDEN